MGCHIAIFTLQGAGHVYPTLGLCAELVRRGHRVSYPATQRYARQLSGLGVEVLMLSDPPVWASAKELYRFPEHPDRQFWNLFASGMTAVFASTASVIAEVGNFYAENKPDLIIYDLMSYSGRILSNRLRVPAIQHWAHFAHQRSVTRERGICLNPEPMIRFSDLLDSFLSMHGIDSKGAFWHKEELLIFFVPRELQFDVEGFDDRFCFVGPCLNRVPGPAWTTIVDGRPLLLVSESSASDSQRNFFSVCVQAFANTKYRVVFSVGNGPQRMLSPMPENFQLNDIGAYNTEILPHAALTICQAGLGTTLESLYYGVPVLGVPITPYHAEVSFRVAELGLGLEVEERELNAQTLRESVDRILADPAVSNRVGEMQKRILNSGGASLAADRIAAFLDQRAKQES